MDYKEIARLRETYTREQLEELLEDILESGNVTESDLTLTDNIIDAITEIDFNSN